MPKGCEKYLEDIPDHQELAKQIQKCDNCEYKKMVQKLHELLGKISP